MKARVSSMCVQGALGCEGACVVDVFAAEQYSSRRLGGCVVGVKKTMGEREGLSCSAWQLRLVGFSEDGGFLSSVRRY